MSATAILLDKRLLEFNLLPSRTLHPSRHDEFLGPHAPEHIQAAQSFAGIWHKHWSRSILDRLGLWDKPVIPAASALPIQLALLPPATLIACMQHIGAALCGTRLRRIIAGAEVRAMLDQLNPALVAFIHQDNMPAATIPESMDWPAQETLAAIEPMGQAVLLQALASYGPPLIERTRLKLPSLSAPKPPLSEDQSLSLAGNILQMLDSSWLSSFSTTH